MTAPALGIGKKRGAAAQTAPWQKIKIDRQVVAIAKSDGVVNVYWTDEDLRKLARAETLTDIATAYSISRVKYARLLVCQRARSPLNPRVLAK